jgi:dihydrofolate reductase
MALTLDGKIGKNPNHYPDWTGKEDKKLFAGISKKAGVVIMGSKTFDTFGRPLPNRKNVILTRKKNRISEWDNLVYTDKKPAEILKDLEGQGYSNVVLAGGAVINSLFAKEKLIDEIIVTISPKIFGYGISLFSDQISMELELKEVEPVGTDLVCLKYKVIK